MIKIWQAFVVLLQLEQLGGDGGCRTYDYVCALRAVTSIDGMTADYANFLMSSYPKLQLEL